MYYIYFEYLETFGMTLVMTQYESVTMDSVYLHLALRDNAQSARISQLCISTRFSYSASDEYLNIIDNIFPLQILHNDIIVPKKKTHIKRPA